MYTVTNFRLIMISWFDTIHEIHENWYIMIPRIKIINSRIHDYDSIVKGICMHPRRREFYPAVNLPNLTDTCTAVMKAISNYWEQKQDNVSHSRSKITDINKRRLQLWT